MNVLSIQSWVAYGHVGNSAAVPCLNALGHTVWAVPTVLYSNHPGHGGFTGRVLPAEEVADLLAGIAARIAARGVLGECAAVLSGYLGAMETGAAVLDVVERTKTANQKALYLCDPVIGDAGRSFVRPGIAEFFRDRALGRADILTPNAFELAFLTGQVPGSLTEAAAAAGMLRAKLRPGGPRLVLVSSLELASLPQQSATLLVHEKGAAAVATPRIAGMPPGSGDVLAALFLGSLLSGAPPEEALSRAASGVHALGEQAAAADLADLPLIASREMLSAPPMLWPAEAVA